MLVSSAVSSAAEIGERAPASVPNRIEGETASDPNSETISGDWGGARSALEGKGITVFGT